MLKIVPRRVKTAHGEQVVWYIKGTCQFTGEQFRRSTRCHRKGDAEAVLIKTVDIQRQKAVFGSSAGLATFGEAVVEYLAKGGEARYLQPLVDAFGDTALRMIEDTDLSREAAIAYPNAVAATLVRQWYGPFQSVWNAAERAKMVHARNVTKPKVIEKPVDYPGDDWLEQVLAASTRLEQVAAILFMSFSGLRAAEVVAVLHRHYDREAATVVVHKTKTDPRTVALPPIVHEVLLQLPIGKPNDTLFGYASRYSLNRIVKRACKRAKVGHFSPHKAGRHAFAARFLADGNSLKALMDAGGWTSVRSVMRYAHMEKKAVDSAVRGVSTPLSKPGVIGSLTGTLTSRTGPNPGRSTSKSAMK